MTSQRPSSLHQVDKLLGELFRVTGEAEVLTTPLFDLDAQLARQMHIRKKMWRFAMTLLPVDQDQLCLGLFDLIHVMVMQNILQDFSFEPVHYVGSNIGILEVERRLHRLPILLRVHPGRLHEQRQRSGWAMSTVQIVDLALNGETVVSKWLLEKAVRRWLMGDQGGEEVSMTVQDHQRHNGARGIAEDCRGGVG